MTKKKTQKSEGDLSGLGKILQKQSGSGNVSFGSVQAGGDVIAGNKMQAGGDIAGGDIVKTTGVTADEIAKLFKELDARIAQLPAEVDKAEVKEAVDAIKGEVQKEASGDEKPDETKVKFSAQALLKMAPDILEVAAASLASPAAGVAAIIRKVINKAKAAE